MHFAEYFYLCYPKKSKTTNWIHYPLLFINNIIIQLKINKIIFAMCHPVNYTIR